MPLGDNKKEDEKTVDPEEVSPGYEVIVGTDKSRAGGKKPGQKPIPTSVRAERRCRRAYREIEEREQSMARNYVCKPP